MDYKKAYEDAIERAKGIYNENPSSSTAKFVCGQIFPEIKESEDERIRKWISDRLLANYSKEDDMVKEALVWLEKQKDVLGERAQNITANMLEDGIEGVQRELIEFLSNTVNASWVDIIQSADAYAERIRNYLEKQKEQKPAETSNIDLDTKVNDWVGYMLNDNAQSYSRKNVQILLDNCARFFYDYAVMCLDKPAEWGEEDEVYLQDVLWCVKQASKVARGENDMGACWSAERWLKSLRPQPQCRDTYYDIIHSILDMLKDMDFMQITPQHRVSLLNDIRVKCKNADECAAILDEPHWKPSEEQMEALEHFIRSWGESGTMSPQNHILCAAKSLYNDLKKL